MDRSQRKTVVLTPRSGDGGGPLVGRALPNGYVLQGRYVIEKQLGAGGFGITYQAKHRYLEDMRVAIKEYLPEGAAVRDDASRVHPISAQHDKIYNWGLHRFLDEARLLRQFQHPNIVAVEDFFEANDTAYLVMNYIRGRSIQSDLDQGREFSEEELRVILYQLLDALSCIHRDGLYHRDISPDNILLREEDDSPVLIDFGSARYEMRMQGNAKSEDDQSPTPTTIFKPGYSPVEQYEGTTQGPYTDIYALAASLYRIAFNVRPIDSLKRSGELRLADNDPLIPAKERGAGKFSEDFLETIDVALRIDPSARPQSVSALLEHLRDPIELNNPETPSPSTPTGNRRRSGLLLAGLLGVLVVGGAYLWQLQQVPAEPEPGDIPGMLAAANRELSKDPFDEDRQTKAGTLYRRVLDLDDFNDQALAGLSAARLLQDFEEALAEEDRAEAVVLMGDIEEEFIEAGVDVDALENGWQRIELIRKLQSLRDSLPNDPLSPKTWEAANLLLVEIGKLPGGTSLAERGTSGVSALQATAEALQRDAFDMARSELAQATEALTAVGVESLPIAVATIDERQQAHLAAREARIADLMAAARQDLGTQPLRSQSIETAAERVAQVLQIDDDNSAALALSRLLQDMLNGYAEIDRGAFESGRELFSSARRIARTAGFDTAPLDRADAYLDEQEIQWQTERTLEALGKQLADAIRLLGESPISQDALEHAARLYDEAQLMSAANPSFAAEHQTASQGRELVSRLQDIAAAFTQSDFATARTKLAEPRTAELARGAGLGPAPLQVVAAQIDQAELVRLRERLGDLLSDDKPLADETLAELGRLVAGIFALAPNDQQAGLLSEALKTQVLSDIARQGRDYPTALAQLQQSIELFTQAGADNPALQAAYAELQDEAAQWDDEQQELRISTLLQQAFDMLRQDPLSADIQAAVGRVFDSVGAIPGDRGRAARGHALIAALQQADAALRSAQFKQAAEALDEADSLLAQFEQMPLDKPRRHLDQTTQRWQKTQAQQREALLFDVDTALRGQNLSEDLLTQIRTAYRAIGDLYQGAKTASVGLALADQLERSFVAMRGHDYAEASAWLDQAEKQLPAAGLDGELLAHVRAGLASQADAFLVDETATEVAALLDDATRMIARSPLDDPTLKQASQALGRAVELNNGLPEQRSQTVRITAALETVFLLRAFAAELGDRQFDAMRQTIDGLRELFPLADVNPALADDLQRIAIDAEIDWRLAQLREFIAQHSWLQSQDLSPAAAQLAALATLQPGHPETTIWQKVVTQLQQMFQEREQREYEDAQESLAEAQRALRQLGVETAWLTTLEQEIAIEQQRWQTLMVERDLVGWTRGAVDALSRRPFDEGTWGKVENLATQILAARTEDERGLALTEALRYVRLAAAALSGQRFDEASEKIRLARTALDSIGLGYALQRAADEIAAGLLQADASELRKVGSLLDSGTGVDRDARLVEAQTSLQQILERTPGHPIAGSAHEAVVLLIEAHRAIAENRYLGADRALQQADERLDEAAVPDVDPLPAIRRLIETTRRTLATQRPSPAEIYPIVSVGLGKIAQAPLDMAELEAAKRLLQNVLGMQADEPSAIGGLATIEHLQAARRAIDSGRPNEAARSLSQAEQDLEAIGIDPSLLQAVRDKVEGLDR